MAVGCGHAAGTRVPGEEARIRTAAIAVGGLDIHINGLRSWTHYDRLRDVLALLEATDYDTIAPFEFHAVVPPSSPEQWLNDTSLAPRAREMGIDIAQVAVLSLTIEGTQSQQHVAIDRQAAEKLGEPTEANAYSARLQAYAELIHPTTGRVLIALERTEPENLFVEIDETDDRPGLTALVRTTVEEVLQLTRDLDVLVPVAPVRAGAVPRARENALAVLDYEGAGLSLRAHLKTLDPTLAEAMMYGRARTHQKALDIHTFEADRRAPLGIETTQSIGTLRAGDRIICIDGRPVVGTWQWRRAYRRGRFRQVTRVREQRAEAVSPTIDGVPSPPPEKCMRWRAAGAPPSR